MIPFKRPYLLVLLGPTAVGKTPVAIQLAQWLDTEIVSADSRQFYREMEIGTAKPTIAERNIVPHHLVDFLSIYQPYNVKAFEEDALRVIREIHERNPVALATGGSGLYIKTLCESIDRMPKVDDSLRRKLQMRYEQEGLEKLSEELRQQDPVYYEQTDLRNPRRVLRALEIIVSSGRPLSGFQDQQKKATRPFHIIKIGLRRDRAILYERINRRVDAMVSQGLLEEARQLYPDRQCHALQTVGYREIFPFLDGQYDQEEAFRLIKRNTRRFAKRQMTWFRKDPDIQWFDADQEEADLLQKIRSFVLQKIS